MCSIFEGARIYRDISLITIDIQPQGLTRITAGKMWARTPGHADLFSKKRITLLWLESRRPSLQFGPDSPFNGSCYYVWLSRLSGAGWLRYLGRGRCVVEIKMRLFEKSSSCPHVLASLLPSVILMSPCGGTPVAIQEMSI
jgi:hypothetical protein